jgi:hypothetical protein
MARHPNEQFVAPAHRTDASLWTKLTRLALQEDVAVRTARITIMTSSRGRKRQRHTATARCTTPEPTVCG